LDELPEDESESDILDSVAEDAIEILPTEEEYVVLEVSISDSE